MGYRSGGFFGGHNDWIWIIIAIVILCGLSNDGCGLFSNDCDRDC
jgi:hypothetical protein